MPHAFGTCIRAAGCDALCLGCSCDRAYLFVEGRSALLSLPVYFGGGGHFVPRVCARGAHRWRLPMKQSEQVQIVIGASSCKHMNDDSTVLSIIPSFQQALWCKACPQQRVGAPLWMRLLCAHPMTPHGIANSASQLQQALWLAAQAQRLVQTNIGSSFLNWLCRSDASADVPSHAFRVLRRRCRSSVFPHRLCNDIALQAAIPPLGAHALP